MTDRVSSPMIIQKWTDISSGYHTPCADKPDIPGWLNIHNEGQPSPFYTMKVNHHHSIPQHHRTICHWRMEHAARVESVHTLSSVTAESGAERPRR